MSTKLSSAYKTIGEVVKILNNENQNTEINTHTLRFWEKQFSQIKPKIFNNQRYYDPDNIELLKYIKFLLKNLKV